jgi:hypothetical protein
VPIARFSSVIFSNFSTSSFPPHHQQVRGFASSRGELGDPIKLSAMVLFEVVRELTEKVNMVNMGSHLDAFLISSLCSESSDTHRVFICISYNTAFVAQPNT